MARLFSSLPPACRVELGMFLSQFAVAPLVLLTGTALVRAQEQRWVSVRRHVPGQPHGHIPRDGPVVPHRYGVSCARRRASDGVRRVAVDRPVSDAVTGARTVKEGQACQGVGAVVFGSL